MKSGKGGTRLDQTTKPNISIVLPCAAACFEANLTIMLEIPQKAAARSVKNNAPSGSDDI